MPESTTVKQPSKLRALPRRIALITLVFALQTLAQQPRQPKPPPATEAEKSFAAEIVALPLDSALQTIATANPSRLTAGLYAAMHDLGNQAYTRDPHQSVILFAEAEAVATRASLPIFAADAHALQASGTLAEGEAFEALQMMDETIAMYRAAAAPATKIAAVDLSRSTAETHLGDIAAAIADAEEALRINREAGEEISVARSQNALGNAYSAAGNFAAAEAAFEDALRLARAHAEKLGEGFVLNNLSMVYALQGDYETAVRYCEESLKIKRAVGAKTDIATSLINLSNFYHLLHRDQDANRVLDEAAQIGRDTNRKIITSKALSEKGIIQLDNHHPEVALPLIKQGDDLGADDTLGHVVNLNKMAEANYALHLYDRSLVYSTEAATIARRSGMADQLSSAALHQGQANVALGKPNDARTAYLESITAVEQMRGQIAGGAAERQQFLAQRIDPYRLLAALDAQQGDWPAALENSERAKGRILLDVYAGNPMNANASLTPAERTEEARLQGRLLSLDMQQERARPGDTALDPRLRSAKSELATFRAKIYAEHPDLQLRRAEFARITPNDLQALVPNRATAVLEYELTSRGNYLFVITRGTRTAVIHGYKLAVSKAELAAHVRRYHDQLASRDPNYAIESRWLYKALVQPASLALQAKQSLIVVPDGVLWHVPFQSLQRPDETFLIEHTAVTYIPSLAVLHALKSNIARHRSLRTLLAMGDPGGETPEQADETHALQNLYGQKNSKAYLGKTATLAQFRLSSTSADVLHIAAHGIFDDRDPMSSHMVLASTTPRPRDGWLQARDLQDMKLHAELVVLSGCETGQGAFEDGEGLVGMSWAALAAGAHGTVSSAWRVEALSTTEMMLSLHRDMLNGLGKSEALRQAQLKLIHSEKYSHPFYWAAFDLMGDGS